MQTFKNPSTNCFSDLYVHIHYTKENIVTITLFIALPLDGYCPRNAAQMVDSNLSEISADRLHSLHLMAGETVHESD